MTPISPAPKPERAPPPKHRFSSIVDKRTHEDKIIALQRFRSDHAGGKKKIPRKAIPKVNAERRQRRSAAFKKRLSRADWKALRLACFKRDGFRCTAGVVVPNTCYPPELRVTVTDRCPNADESRTGRGLIADHKTYARFGHENLEDLRTLCRSCNARLTKQLRANHANGFQGRGGQN